MPGDREAILEKVRRALAPLARRAALPDYDSGVELARNRQGAGDPVGEFTARLRAVNGEVVADPASLAAALRARGWFHGYCDPVLNLLVEGRQSAHGDFWPDCEVLFEDSGQRDRRLCPSHDKDFLTSLGSRDQRAKFCFRFRYRERFHL